MSRAYLLTGAAGFLGGEICRQLIDRHCTVRAFVLPNDPAAKYLPAGVEICEGDLCSASDVERFFTVPAGVNTVVIHCASIVALGTEPSELVMNVNVGGTKHIIAQCLSHPECEKLVYVGSTGAIPELPKGQAMKEITRFDANKVVSAYGQSKAVATQAVLDAVREKGLNACVVQPSGILGPGDVAMSQTTTGILQQMQGEVPVAVNGTFNLCDVRDLAAGTLAAVERGKAGECYILANEVVSYPEFARLVAEEGHCKQPVFYLPLWLAHGVAWLLKQLSRATGKAPALTEYMIYNLSRNNVFDSSKARQELGYTSRPFRETIRDEVQWLREGGYLKESE